MCQTTKIETVGDLINLLQDFPQDMPILLPVAQYRSLGSFCHPTELEVEEGNLLVYGIE